MISMTITRSYGHIIENSPYLHSSSSISISISSSSSSRTSSTRTNGGDVGEISSVTRLERET